MVETDSLAARGDDHGGSGGSGGSLGGGGHRGTRAVQRMVEFAPSTGGLALWMQHRDLPADDQAVSNAAPAASAPPAPPVATDGHSLFYSPGFEQWSSAEQVGLVAHEVLHIALRHPQRFVDLQQLLGDVDLKLFNVCADAIINSALGHLSWLKLPAFAVQLDGLLANALGIHQDVEKSLLEWDVEQLYRAIDDRRLPAQSGGRSGQRGGDAKATAPDATESQSQAATPQGSPALGPGPREDGPRSSAARAMGTLTPIDLQPDTGAMAAPETEAESAREWGERLLRAHAGDGAFSMLRALIADLPRMRTPWEQVLRTQLARALTPRRTVSWSRPARSYLANQGRTGPHRRMPWEPGFSGVKSVPKLVVIVDVSGSIDKDLMARFAREIEAITRRLEAGLVLVIGDDQVRRVERFAPDDLRPKQLELHRIEFEGGGGTDFTPLLEEADHHRPDIAVVLTDLEGPARMRPRWPVIWAVPESCAAAVAPFGRKLGLR